MKIGWPLWKPNNESLWYYWIDGKQSYPSGDLWATTLVAARRKIRRKHPGCTIDIVKHYNTYHAMGAIG